MGIEGDLVACVEMLEVVRLKLLCEGERKAYGDVCDALNHVQDAIVAVHAH